MGTLISWMAISLALGATFLLAAGIFQTFTHGGKSGKPGWVSFVLETFLYTAPAFFIGFIVLNRDYWFGIAFIAGGVFMGCFSAVEEVYAVKYGRTNSAKDGFKRELQALPASLVLFVASAPLFIVGMKVGSMTAEAYPHVVPGNKELGSADFLPGEFGVIAIWILWSLYFHFAKGKSGPSGMTLGAALNGVGHVSKAFGDTVSNLVAFVKGGLWLLLGAFVVYIDWPPGSGFGWIIFGLGVVAAGKGLSFIGPVLIGTPTLAGDSPHGDARDATPGEAQQAARGGAQSSIDDRRFRV
jgi:hypothetical protein